MRLTIITSLILLSSCGTVRTYGDYSLERETGERNMTSLWNCLTATGCFKKSVAKAQSECRREKKEYKYLRFNQNILTYKCIEDKELEKIARELSEDAE